MERIADQAKRIASGIEKDDGVPEWDSSHINPLRDLASQSEDRLREQGWLEHNRGAETLTWHDWQERRRSAYAPHLFDFLLKDAMETHIVFYTVYHGFDNVDEFVQFLRETPSEGGSEVKVLETYQRLAQAGVPDELYERQSTMLEFQEL